MSSLLNIEILRSGRNRRSIDETELVMVDIKGAVQNPYVYTMQAEQRVIDVIHRAGGLLETASTDSINLAQKVYDGMVVYVPTEEEAESGLGWGSLNANSISILQVIKVKSVSLQQKSILIPPALLNWKACLESAGGQKPLLPIKKKGDIFLP